MDMKSIPSLADRLKPKIKAWVAYVIWGTPITPGVQEELQINWRLHDAGGGYMCGGPMEHPPRRRGLPHLFPSLHRWRIPALGGWKGSVGGRDHPLHLWAPRRWSAILLRVWRATSSSSTTRPVWPISRNGLALCGTHLGCAIKTSHPQPETPSKIRPLLWPTEQ